MFGGKDHYSGVDPTFLDTPIFDLWLRARSMAFSLVVKIPGILQRQDRG